MILMCAHTDRMGNIFVAPVRRDWRAWFARIVRDNGGEAANPLSDYETAFFQEGGPAEEFMGDIPKRAKLELRKGYTVRFRADLWIVGHWYGFGAHTAAE